MSSIKVISGSCVDQYVDAIVNAANKSLLAGSGVCGEIFRRAGLNELSKACREYNTPLNDGDAVITPAFGISNAKSIIHAVGPNFMITPDAMGKLYSAYYNSLIVLKENDLHSIAFPLISSGIFGGNLENPAGESTRMCLLAYNKFIAENKDYDIEVLLCAYTEEELIEAENVYNSFFGE